MTAFEKICEENYPRIFKYILGMTGQKECAQDLTQEVFFIAYKKGKSFERHEKPEAFLYKTAKNLVLAWFQSSQKEILKEPDEDIASQEGDLFDQLCRNHENSVMEELYRDEVFSHVSPKYMELYRRYYVEHQSMKEIAAATQHFGAARHFENGLIADDSYSDAEAGIGSGENGGSGNNTGVDISGGVTESAGDSDSRIQTSGSIFEEQPVLSGENANSQIEVLSEEEGTEDTAWVKKSVYKVTDEGYTSDDGVNWEADAPDVKKVTEYTYTDYDTACADMGLSNLLQKSFDQNGTVVFRNTHFLDGEMADVSNLTAGFKYGNGKFTLEQSSDQESGSGQNILITSTEGVTNQREYVSKNGDTFALSDDTETGEIRTTTMVTYGNTSVILTFTGLSEDEIHKILDAVSTEK